MSGYGETGDRVVLRQGMGRRVTGRVVLRQGMGRRVTGRVVL